MGNFGIDNDNRFTIESPELKTVDIEDPDNWDSDDKVYSYDKLGGGTLVKNNTSLELIGKGYDSVYAYPLVYGYGSDLTLTKWIKSPTKKGEDWRISYQTGIDLLNAEFDRSRTKPVARVQFTQGGLYDRIAARYKDKYDLVITKDADGNDIGELETIEETVSGREIFRISKGTVEDGLRKRHIVTGADKDNATAVPFIFKPNSDSGNIEDVLLSTAHVGYNNGDYADGSVSHMVFIQQDRYHKRILNGRVKIKIVDGDRGRIHIQKVFYKYNTTTTTYEFTENENLADIDSDSFGQFLEYNFVDHVVELEKDEAMSIVIFSNTNDGIEYQYFDTYLNITEDDTFVPTTAKCILPHEMIDRFLEKITGEKGLLVSNVFGRKDLGYKEDGEWAYLGVSSGFWARGFDIGQPVINNETGEPEPPKQLTISLKDAFESFNVADPLFWGIEKIKGKEYFRLEKYGYTQQDFIGIRMGRGTGADFKHIPVSKPVESVLGDNIFTGIKIGYEKGGSQYEEISGLSAPHGNAEYNTYLKTSPNVYTKVSKIRADPEGYDLARRLQAVYYPDTDTTYDQDLFFRDLKKVGAQYVSRTWEDDFEVEPKNIYSPGTATNLRLTPFRCLLRHGRIISTGISKRPNEKLVWISSNCNSDLITKEAGKNELAENGFVTNKDLGVPFIDGRLLKFDGKVYQSMIDEIEGYNMIDGERIPNWFGLFEVMVQGRLMYGRLSSSNIKGEGKHEIALI